MAQGFQRDIPGQDPATYINRGAVTPQNNWAAQGVQAVAQNIASPIKTGYGLGMGEKIMNDTMDEFLSVTEPSRPVGEVQSIGLDGSVNQFDAQGNKVGESAPIDPTLVGDSRTRAVQESTKDFNKNASKLRRAYESGMIDDREFFARLSMNLREAENKYPMFKEEIAQQAQRMLSDELYYFHYTSAVSSFAAEREKREAQANQQQKWRNSHIEAIAKYYGFSPNLVNANYDRMSAKYAQDIAMDNQRDVLKDELTIQKGRNAVSEHEYMLQKRSIERLAREEANTYIADGWDDGRSEIMNTLGVDDPRNIHIALGAASGTDRARIKEGIEIRKQRKIEEFRQSYSGVDVEQHVERISQSYDDLASSVDEPFVWEDMKGKDAYLEAQARDSMGFNTRQAAVLSEVMAGLGPAAQMRAYNVLQETGVIENLSNQLKDAIQYNPSEGRGNLEDTSAVNRSITDATIDYSFTAEGEGRQEELRDLYLNGLASEQRNIQELRAQGSREANAAQRDTIRTITKLFGRSPEVLQGDSDTARMLREEGNRNIDTYLTSAASAAISYIGEGSLQGLRVNPTNGLVTLVGDQTNTPARTALTIGGQQSDGKRFVDDINKAIMAKAALSGDTSVSNIREISQMIVNQIGASAGDEQGIRSYISQIAPAYGIDPNIALRIAQTESNFNPQAVNEGSGASGIFQLTEGGGAADVGMDWDQRFNPVENVKAGLQYYKKVRDVYVPYYIGPDNEEDKEVLALMAYNWGIGKLQDYIQGEVDSVPSETKNYVKKTYPGKTWAVVNKYRNRYLYDDDNGPENQEG